MAVIFACLLWFTPASAFAERLASDQVGGIALEDSGLRPKSAPDIDAPAGLIVAGDGRELWARSAAAQRPPASITKTMMALVVLDRADLDEQVVVSEAASRVDYAVGLKPGERRTVRELLELALVASSNDAAHALAEHVGGSATAFVALMNERGAELGLDDTRFVNAHGLDARGHYSSAEDIAVLATTAMKDKRFRRIVAMRHVTLPAYKKRPTRRLKATNDLLGAYEGIEGGKTGFTDGAGYSLVAVAERDGVVLTSVVLGARSSSARFRYARRLLDWGFKHYRRETIANATETVGAVPASANPAREVAVRFAQTASAPVFDLEGPVVRSISLPDRVELPVFEGQPIGTVELKQGERVLMELPVVVAADMASAAETVGAVPVADYLDRTVVVRTSDATISVPSFETDLPLEKEVRLDASADAPVKVGDPLGHVIYSQQGREIVRVPVVAASAVDAPGVLRRIGTWFARGWRKLLGEPIMASPRIVG